MPGKPTRSEQIVRLAQASPGIKIAEAAEILGMSKESLSVYASKLRKRGELEKSRGTLVPAGDINKAAAARPEPGNDTTSESNKQRPPNENEKLFGPIVQEACRRAETYRQEGVLTNLVLIGDGGGEITVRGAMGGGAMVSAMVGHPLAKELEELGLDLAASQAQMIRELGGGDAELAVFVNMTDVGGDEEPAMAVLCAWHGGERMLAVEAEVEAGSLLDSDNWKPLAEDRLALLYELGRELSAEEDAGSLVLREREPATGERGLGALGNIMADPERAPILRWVIEADDAGNEQLNLGVLDPQVGQAISDQLESPVEILEGGDEVDPFPNRGWTARSNSPSGQNFDEMLPSSVRAICSVASDAEEDAPLLQLAIALPDGSLMAPLALMGKAASPWALFATFAVPGIMARYDAAWAAIIWISPKADDRRTVVAASLEIPRPNPDSDPGSLELKHPEMIAADFEPGDLDGTHRDLAEPPEILSEMAQQLVIGSRMINVPSYRQLRMPEGDEMSSLKELADMVASSFSGDDLKDASLQRAAIAKSDNSMSVIDLPGVPDERRDAHIYFLVPSFLLNRGAKAVAITSPAANDDGIDGTMTLVVSGSGAGFIQLWFPDLESSGEITQAAGPQVAALRDALAASS